MENAKISNLYDLDETIAKEYLEQFTYPWEALKGISEFIKKLGPTLDPEKFEKRGEDIWVAKSAKAGGRTPPGTTTLHTGKGETALHLPRRDH